MLLIIMTIFFLYMHFLESSQNSCSITLSVLLCFCIGSSQSSLYFFCRMQNRCFTVVKYVKHQVVFFSTKRYQKVRCHTNLKIVYLLGSSPFLSLTPASSASLSFYFNVNFTHGEFSWWKIKKLKEA